MSERIVSPEEARRVIRVLDLGPEDRLGLDLLHTVATEPDRVRAAVVQVLRRMQSEAFNKWSVKPYVDEWVKGHADAIESGADF